MNKYKGVLVSLLLFFVMQLHAESKPIDRDVKPVSMNIVIQDTCNAYLLHPYNVDPSPNPEKKKTKAHKKKKEVFIGISETTGNTILGVFEVITYLVASFCKGNY